MEIGDLLQIGDLSFHVRGDYLVLRRWRAEVDLSDLICLWAVWLPLSDYKVLSQTLPSPPVPFRLHSPCILSIRHQGIQAACQTYHSCTVEAQLTTNPIATLAHGLHCPYPIPNL